MPHFNPMHTYPPGSIVQHRDGYKYIKLESGSWQRFARHVYEQEHSLSKHQRVYHINGKRGEDEVNNLVAITFNASAFRPLPHAIPVFIPAREHRSNVVLA